MKKISIMICVLISCVSFAQDSAKTAEGMSEAAYKLLLTADEAHYAGEPRKAFEGYAGAMKAYRSLAAAYPKWDPDIVTFRIDYCKDQAESLVKKLGPETVKKMPEAGGQRSEVGGQGARGATTDNRQQTTGQRPEVGQKKTEDPPAKRAFDVTRVEKAPKEPTTVHEAIWQGREYLRKNDLVNARRALMKGMSYDADSLDIRLLLGMVQCRSGRYDDASYILAEVITDDGSNAVAHVVLGTAYFGMGRAEDAGKLMTRAIEIDPRLHEAHYNMAQIVLATKPMDIATARQHYKKALSLGAKPDENLAFLLKE